MVLAQRLDKDRLLDLMVRANLFLILMKFADRLQLFVFKELLQV